MVLFFSELIRTLDKMRKGWRNDHVILLDNAPYHVSKSTMAVLEGLNIPVLFTGPHSYDAGK